VADWVPHDVAAIVARAISVRPDKRYQNARDMQAACAAALENYTSTSRRAPDASKAAPASEPRTELRRSAGEPPRSGAGSVLIVIGDKRIRVRMATVVAALFAAVMLGAIGAALLLSWLNGERGVVEEAPRRTLAVDPPAEPAKDRAQ
jgi:hypothetical protein